MAYLNLPGFKESLNKIANYDSCPYAEVKLLLKDKSEEESKEYLDGFLTCQRIMKARTLDEVADVPLEKIIDCINYSYLFSEIYERKKAVDYFKKLLRIKVFKTCRKRRVL